MHATSTSQSLPSPPAPGAHHRRASQVDDYNNRYETFADEFSSILLRQAFTVTKREAKG